MRTLNLGILAHVDAGKTSLTEQLLYHAGVIDEVGSVDHGNTRTDSLPLEQQRGITIKSAVVSFVIDDVTINLIDTPGHPDFIAEVERVLSVLDGAVLVVSAVEGVQPQTRVLMRTLQRLHIPTVIFANKIDRAGAGYERVLQATREKLTPAFIAMGSAHDLGTRSPGFTPYGASDADFLSRLTEFIADHDETFLAAYVNDEADVSDRKLREMLAKLSQRALVYPVYFGSAITGTGVGSLIAGIREFLPTKTGDADGPVSGTVFKIERGPAGEKIAYARMFSGTIRVRDHVQFGQGHDARVTRINVFDRGVTCESRSVAAGQIGKLWGLGDVRIGDAIGTSLPDMDRHYFAPPTLETIIVPHCFSDRGALNVALTQIAEQDPLINLRWDDVQQELYVSLYGEVQKEVIQETLRSEYDLDVEFRETTTICVERPVGTGAAFEIIDTDPNPFLATVGLRIEPAPINSGVTYQPATEVLGTMPHSFFNAVEETVYETLRQGLHGWEVTDCTVTLTHTGYWPRQSHAHQGFDKSMSSTGWDFRSLTPLVLMDALKQAGTKVYGPMHRFHLEFPIDALGPMLPVLAQLGAIPETPTIRGAVCGLEGEIPAERVNELQQLMPDLTRGEGVLESAFERYEAIRGTVPTRPRADHNPLNRKEYLLHVLRRV